MKKIRVKNRKEWRDRLSANHDKEAEVWLIFYKKDTGRASIEYEASVEEVLCFGWIDSIIKKLDRTKYVRKLTPRRANSKWSVTNKKRAEKLMREGLMTEHGMREVEAARRNGNWDRPVRKPELTLELPSEFSEALNANRSAKENFDKLAATYRRQYIGWIKVAKRPETRERRIRESILLLEEGKKLGLR